jgi:hypothetical protein
MLGTKVMKKELNYLALKRWIKVGRQELRLFPINKKSTPGGLHYDSMLVWMRVELIWLNRLFSSANKIVLLIKIGLQSCHLTGITLWIIKMEVFY